MDTGLYYLQSRYYDPELGRFINSDAFTSAGQGLLGNNMFAYCGNSPVNYSDPSGYYLANALNDDRIYNPGATRKVVQNSTEYCGTVSMGLSGSVGVGPWVWGGQASITLDANGYAAFQYGISAGVCAGPDSDKFSAAVMPFAMVTNAKGYRGLEGNSVQMGGSIPPYTLDYGYC